MTYKQPDNPRPTTPAGALYVHVPFCLAKCRYCDFYSLPLTGELAGRYVRALTAELRMHIIELRRPVDSVFLGGGTPTALGADMLTRLLSELSPLADSRTEFSVEANPGTVTPQIADALVAGGVNRVNLGVQSLVESELKLLGRIHSSAQAREAIGILRSSGIDNLGLDLIYGIPGQSLESWRASVAQALEMGISHLSCYALSFEPQTPLWRDLSRGAVSPMDESLQKECYFAAIEQAAAAGLEHYEISNFAAPGRRCGHNITYWKNRPYLGLGPAAASYIGGDRRKNAPDLESYISSLEAGRAPQSQSEHLTGRAEMAETIMLGLRMIAGLDRREFAERFSQDAVSAFPQSIERYRRQGAVEVTQEAVRIRREYLFVADTILADILAEA